MRSIVVVLGLLIAGSAQGAVNAPPDETASPRSVPSTSVATPVVDVESVELFLDLAPRVFDLERRQMRKLDEIRRAHHDGRAERLNFQLFDLWRTLEWETGVSMEFFVALRAAVVDAHRRLYVLRRLLDERAALLAQWQYELATKQAADEVFVAARERLDRELALAQAAYARVPEEARYAVETYSGDIARALRPPVRMSRAERRERAERARELLPPPPTNPYRESCRWRVW